MPENLKRLSLRDQVRDHLLALIGRGTLAAGDRIVEARLCEDLGVSSIPVREAIRELVALGVLTFETHKGARVREVSMSETIDALQVKAVLESLAARLATPKLAGAKNLRRIYGQILKAAKRKDFADYQQRNQEFHRHIVETAGNAALLRTWSSLAFDVRTRFIMEFMANGDPVAIALDHVPILEAFEAGDGERAAELLSKHANDLIGFLAEKRSQYEAHGSETTLSLKTATM